MKPNTVTVKIEPEIDIAQIVATLDAVAEFYKGFAAAVADSAEKACAAIAALKEAIEGSA